MKQQRPSISVRPLVESALLAALGSVLVLVGYYVPVLGTLITLMWPLPCALAVIRHDVRWGILCSIVTGLTLLPFVDWITAASLWILFALTGVTFGYAIKRGYSPVNVILISSVAFLVGTLAAFASAYLVTGFTPAKLIDDFIQAMDAAVKTNEKLFGPNPALDQFRNMSQVRDQLVQLMPALVLFSALFQAYINFEVARRVLKRVGYSVEPLPPFQHWIMPELTAHAAFLSFIAMLSEPYHHLHWLTVAGQNVFLFMEMILIIDALALASYYLARLNVPRFFIGLMFVLVYFNPALNTLAAISGMIDVLFDFRKLRYGF